MSNKSDYGLFKELMRGELGYQFGPENVAAFWGNQNAKIVSISQAPSLRAIRARKPFFDKSGEKLRKIWYQISDEVFYNPDNFYFTAIGMYYPGKGKHGDLKPSFEVAKKWLKREIEYLSPKLFLLVGTLSAKFFFPEQAFIDLVLNDHEINGVKTLVLPHPSPLNIKWFKHHPEFESKRLSEIRKAIHDALELT